MPRFIWGKWGESEYKRRETDEGATFRDHKNMRVSCTVCGVTMTAYYLKDYMVRIHGICTPQTRRFDGKG